MSSSAGAFLNNLTAGAQSQKTALNIVLSIASILSLIVLGLIIAQIVRATTPGQGASATDAISISIYVLAALAALAWIIYGVYKSKFDKSPIGQIDAAASKLSSRSAGSAAAGSGVGSAADQSTNVGLADLSETNAPGLASAVQRAATGSGSALDRVRALAPVLQTVGQFVPAKGQAGFNAGANALNTLLAQR